MRLRAAVLLERLHLVKVRFGPLAQYAHSLSKIGQDFG
jgi:hypothetical protein